MFREIKNDIVQSFREGGIVTRLIYINIAVFVVMRLLGAFGFFFNQPQIAEFLKHLLMVPANPQRLLFRFWTPLTYMFYHHDLIHALFNMLILYWFGRIFLMFFNSRQLLTNYLIGGLIGAAFYVIAYNLFPGFNEIKQYAVMLGASASIMAIVFTAAFYSPDYTINLMFIGPVKLKWIAVFYVVSDLIFMADGNAGGHIAHLGGAFWGYMYFKNLNQGKDPSVEVTQLLGKAGSLFKRKSKLKVTYKNARHLSDEQYNANKAATQEQVDQILDKIAKSGYKSLSKSEKELLFKFSKK